MTINIVNEGEQLVAQLSGRLDTAAAAEIAPDFQALAEYASLPPASFQTQAWLFETLLLLIRSADPY